MICNAFSASGITPAQEHQIGALMAKAVGRERRTPSTPRYTPPQVTDAAMARAETHILACLAHGPLRASDMLAGTGMKRQQLSNLLGILHQQRKITAYHPLANHAAVWSLSGGVRE